MKNLFTKILLILISITCFIKIVSATTPIIDNATGSIDDNSMVGTLVLTSSGSDADGDILNYDIISGNTGSAFLVDNSGAITLNNSIDFHTTPQYNLVVELTANGETATGSVVIDVIDKTNPVFDSFILSSNNSNSSYAKEGDIVEISLNIDTADTWETGNKAFFSIGTGAVVGTRSFTSSNTPRIDRNVSYDIGSGENGEFKFISLNFEDKEGNTITNFSSPYSPTSNIIVDTIAPIISFTDDVSVGPTFDERIKITVTDTNEDTSSYKYIFTNSGSCDSNSDFSSGLSFTSGTNILFETESNNTKYICAIAKDLAGNESYISSINPLNIDRTRPTIINSNIISNSGALAKEGDEITLTFEFDEEVNVLGATILGNAGIITQSGTTNIYTSKYITQNADTNGIVNFEINAVDLAGNSLIQVVNPTIDLSKVIYDNINPVLNIVDNIEAGPVQTDILNITATDTNADITTFQYAFTDNNICDGNVTFTDTFSSGVDIVFNDETKNGKYICSKAEDLAGNVSYSVSPQDINIDVTIPTLLNSTIISNNTNSGALAKEGDEITLTFELNEKVNLPIVEILGNNSTVTQSGTTNIYNAKYTIQNIDTEGLVNFRINADDLAGNSLVEVVNPTTDGTTVNFDKTAPTILSSTIISNNTNSGALAKEGDEITLTFESSEEIKDVEVMILNNTGSLTNSGNIYTATYTTQNGDSEGIVDFTINATDLVGNNLVEVITTSDSSKVIYDKTAPMVLNYNLTSNNANSPDWAKVGDELTLTFEFNEAINDTEIMFFSNTGSITITQSGATNIYTAKYKPTNSDAEGKINFSINASDLAGNELLEVSDISDIIFDRTKPNFNMIIWYINNKIEMEYDLFDNYEDPGTENLSDNFMGSGSLSGKYIIAKDLRPNPGPNISGRYSIVYSVEDVAGNKRTKVRNVIVHGKDRSVNYIPMDICNNTKGDKSGDYHDGICLIDGDKTIKAENIEYREEIIEEIEEQKIEEEIINNIEKKSDIEKFNANIEDINKYKIFIKSKYGKIISKIPESKIKKIILRMDNLLEKKFTSKIISDKKREDSINLIIALKEVILEK